MGNFTRLLITTADETAWRSDGKVLFLGEWCRLLSRRHIWSGLDAEVAPYHWNDRVKLRQDFNYLQALNAEIISELSIKLNNIHNVSYSSRYWAVLIGYWLNLFTAVLYDRWEMLRLASEGGIDLETIVYNSTDADCVAGTTFEFGKLIQEDLWNHHIYSKLLDYFPSIRKLRLKETCMSKAGMIKPEPGFVGHFKKMVKRVLDKVSGLVGRNNVFFLYNTYLPSLYLFRLAWKLGDRPTLFMEQEIPSTAFDPTMRDWTLPSAQSAVKFENVVREIIPHQLPRIFLEWFNNLQLSISSLSWPSNPRVIVTTEAHYFDEVFKAWAAEKIEEGVPLVTIDHGGFGINQFNGAIAYQHAISDVSLSWGFESTECSIVKPFGVIKNVGLQQDWDSAGDALMVQVSMPRYSYDIRSMVIAGQMLDYFDWQYRFYGALPEYLQDRVLVRLYSNDYGWSQEARWKEQFPGIKLDLGYDPISRVIRKSRLYIATYNATTYLESLAWNIPTIIFWDPSYWELREEAIPYFELLKSVGIFHETPESAAAQMTTTWDGILSWWQSETVQNSRRLFCDRYCRMPDQPLDLLERTLRDIVSPVGAKLR